MAFRFLLHRQAVIVSFFHHHHHHRQYFPSIGRKSLTFVYEASHRPAQQQLFAKHYYYTKFPSAKSITILGNRIESKKLDHCVEQLSHRRNHQNNHCQRQKRIRKIECFPLPLPLPLSLSIHNYNYLVHVVANKLCRTGQATKQFCTYCDSIKIMASTVLPSSHIQQQSQQQAKYGGERSSFLFNQATPNILIYFATDQRRLSPTRQSHLVHEIDALINQIFGIDRFVVYPIRSDELLSADSRSFSASALLVIHHDGDDHQMILKDQQFAQIPLSLERLCANYADESVDRLQLDRNYFIGEIESRIATSERLRLMKSENITSDDHQTGGSGDGTIDANENRQLDDTITFLIDFDRVRDFDAWRRMQSSATDFNSVTNIVEYERQIASKPICAFDISTNPDTVYLIDWKRVDSAVERDKTLAAAQIDFDLDRYFSTLRTNYIGRCLTFTERVSSTMTLANRFRHIDGMVAIANYQTAGIGRNANRWLSPKGCAMFTISLMVPISSAIARRLPLVQHLAALSIVLSLPSDELNVRIKWPNDILFAESRSKLAGILVRSYCTGAMINLQIGVGINLSNRKPSVCLDEVIALYNARQPAAAPLALIPKPVLIGNILNNFERLLQSLSNDERDDGLGRTLPVIKKMYLDRWIHSDAIIEVRFAPPEDGDADARSVPPIVRSARIRGIDDDGYLLAEDLQNGEMITLTPDGNRFDLMNNLVIIKNCTQTNSGKMKIET